MADYTLSSISNIDPNMRKPPENDRLLVADSTGSRSTAKTNAQQNRPEKAVEVTHEPAQPESSSSIALKFRVDDKTHEITVFVVDRASQQVLRTIPADEFRKLHAGELIKLLA